MPNTNDLKVLCQNCNYSSHIDKDVARKALKIDQYASTEDIRWHLSKQKQKLKCTKCGSRNATIVPGENVENVENDNVPRRYIDEGIGGTREDNRRMRGRQSARNRKPIA